MFYNVDEGRVIESPPAKDAPAPAKARPVRTAVVSRETEAYAMIVPAKLLEEPSEALELTCQKMLIALAPFCRMKLVLVEVIRELDAWNTQVDVMSPWPLRVRVPAENVIGELVAQ